MLETTKQRVGKSSGKPHPHPSTTAHAPASSPPPGTPPVSGKTRKSIAFAFFETRAGQQHLRKLLELGLNDFQIKLNRDLLQQLTAGCLGWIKTNQKAVESRLRSVMQLRREKWLQDERQQSHGHQASQAPRFVCDFLRDDVQARLKRIADLKQLFKQFCREMLAPATIKERHEIILQYASELGSDAATLRKDKRALERWFDAEALSDRFVRTIGEEEMQLAFLLDRLAQATLHVFYRSIEFSTASTGGNIEDQVKRISGIWQRLNTESTFLGALIHDGDSRIHVAALTGLRVILTGVSPTISTQLLSQRLLDFIDRAARQNNSDVWMQCEALTILAALSFPVAQEVMRLRLESPSDNDDLFVRQHIWDRVEVRLRNFPDQRINLPTMGDPSPFVRQRLATACFVSALPEMEHTWRTIVLDDEHPKVRAAALTVGLDKSMSLQHFINFLKVIPDVLRNENDPFVLRTAFHCTSELIAHLLNRIESQTGAAAQKPSQTLFTALAIIQQEIIPSLLDIQQQHPDIPVRRFASHASETIWSLLDPDVRQLITRLKPKLKKIRRGRSIRLPLDWFSSIDDVTLGRMFAVLSQKDFGYDIHRNAFGVRIGRGPSFGFRLWRFLFEIQHSATDKRQAHRHTTGRISTATLRAPSQITGELSETKVPGEPLVIGTDGTWRPFLPLPDDFISLINLSWFKSRTVRFVTSQGITAVTAPPTLRRRIWAAWKVTTQLPRIAAARNVEGDALEARKYLQAFENLGFEVDFQPHRHRPAPINAGADQAVAASPTDPSADSDSSESTGTDSPRGDSSVTQFFAAAVLVLPVALATAPATWLVPLLNQMPPNLLPQWFTSTVQRFTSYFTSLYENSLEELILFTSVFFVLVMLKHFWANFSFRRARRKIQFSIGGWGTRGKSGTERLKAALMSVLGYGLVSKTTGCEAMFIQSFAYGEPLEIPLFRPYDKATIWEQKNLVGIASKLNASVFLWECMALNPDYVNVLQRQWMMDDLTTITNTYPDHEDVQGPAGHNVAETIAGFVPPKSVMVTTEEQMLPYIADQCRDFDTELQTVGWLESGLITEDILKRFPYQEHPDNIALVARMAQNIGVPKNVSFKAMADDLIPDLGVLKTHPVATVRHRKLEFTNGMSANERFGCMGNWKRLGYAEQNHLEDPGTWICGVVNNRADRVPRSGVFAKVIVNDINADRFFLIGTNLNGLQNFIAQAWEEKEATLTLLESDGTWNQAHALETLERSAIKARQPLNDDDILARLKLMLSSAAPPQSNELEDISSSDQTNFAIEAMLAGLPDKSRLEAVMSSLEISNEDQSAITDHYQKWQTVVTDYQTMREIIEDAPESIADTVNEKYRALLRKWFQQKIVVVPEADATGEEIITRIVEEVPPGHLARMMGLQNIKGTGLDFVYRFHAWDVCYEACEATQDRQVATAEKALRALNALPEIGQLCTEKVRHAIAQCRANPQLQSADLQLLVDQLENRLGQQDRTTTALQETLVVRIEKESKWHIRAQLAECLIEWTEQFLDVNDSLRRREKSERIYRDLVDCRIGRQRAITELRKLNKRQKGGWLKEDSRKVRTMLTRAAKR